MSSDDDNKTTGITQLRNNDVLCGRGGAALRHQGNVTYRWLVKKNKELYIRCQKAEKTNISKSIVAAIREEGGRFLEKERNSDTWYDIGDKKAIEKTSQALREGQPDLIKKIFVAAPEAVESSPTSLQSKSSMHMNSIPEDFNPQNFSSIYERSAYADSSKPSLTGTATGTSSMSSEHQENKGINVREDENQKLDESSRSQPLFYPASPLYYEQRPVRSHTGIEDNPYSHQNNEIEFNSNALAPPPVFLPQPTQNDDRYRPGLVQTPSMENMSFASSVDVDIRRFFELDLSMLSVSGIEQSCLNIDSKSEIQMADNVDSMNMGNYNYAPNSNQTNLVENNTISNNHLNFHLTPLERESDYQQHQEQEQAAGYHEIAFDPQPNSDVEEPPPIRGFLALKRSQRLSISEITDAYTSYRSILTGMACSVRTIDSNEVHSLNSGSKNKNNKENHRSVLANSCMEQNFDESPTRGLGERKMAARFTTRTRRIEQVTSGSAQAPPPSMGTMTDGMSQMSLFSEYAIKENGESLRSVADMSIGDSIYDDLSKMMGSDASATSSTQKSS